MRNAIVQQPMTVFKILCKRVHRRTFMQTYKFQLHISQKMIWSINFQSLRIICTKIKQRMFIDFNML